MISKKELEKYDYYIFDCDGVILNSNQIKSEVFYDIALKYGKTEAEDFLKYHQSNQGISRFEKIKYLHEYILSSSEGKVEEDIEHFSKKVKQSLLSCSFVDGVIDFIKKISQRHNLYVSSGAEERELIEVLEYKEVASYFKFIKGSPESKFQHLEFICKYEKGRKGLFFGDAIEDYKVSQKGQLDFIFVDEFSSHSTREFFKSISFSNKIKNFSEII